MSKWQPTLEIEDAYKHGNEKRGYLGRILKDGFEEYLADRVNRWYYDVEGKEQLAKLFDEIPVAGFDKVILEIASSREKPTDWRIGESLTECYLEDYDHVKFLYKSSRDDKNPNSNSHGADIVGILTKGEVMFVFGEIKTSGDAANPPRIVYGKSGLIEQLTRIKSYQTKREDLVKWLGHKVYNLNTSDENRELYHKAARAFIQSKFNKVRIIGVMIRDTVPHENDLKTPYDTLTREIHDDMALKLLALYVPIRISELGTSMGDDVFVN